MKILFVCTGNTCRSAMAEGIAKDLLKKENISAEVSSAGVFATFGLSASENAVLALNEIGIDISKHISKPLSKEMLQDAYLVLTMTKSHKNAILSKYPQFSDKVFTLFEFIGEDKDVNDPFGRDLETYRKSAIEIKQAIEKIIKKIKES